MPGSGALNLQPLAATFTDQPRRVVRVANLFLVVAFVISFSVSFVEICLSV
jgi:hypothetical protein